MSQAWFSGVLRTHFVLPAALWRRLKLVQALLLPRLEFLCALACVWRSDSNFRESLITFYLCSEAESFLFLPLLFTPGQQDHKLPGYSPISLFHLTVGMLRSQTCAMAYGFFCGFWGSNSGDEAFLANTSKHRVITLTPGSLSSYQLSNPFDCIHYNLVKTVPLARCGGAHLPFQHLGGGSGVQGRSWQHSKLQANLSSTVKPDQTKPTNHPFSGGYMCCFQNKENGMLNILVMLYVKKLSIELKSLN